MKTLLKRLLLGIGLFLVIILAVVYVVGAGWFGSLEYGGLAQGLTTPAPALAERGIRQRVSATAAFGESSPKQVLFGDLHVHTTFSFDAYTMSLPVAEGDVGSHPPADACDYARYCSALDFWSINDHAEQITPRLWRETIDAIRQCNDLAGDSSNPDTVAFLGWEWTQTGPTPEAHFGHKNVILKHTGEEAIPQRPLAAPGQGMPIPPALVRGAMALAAGDSRSVDLMAYLRELEATPLCDDTVDQDCREVANDPNQLFQRLDELNLDAMVIPHGTTWGIYTPPVSDWRKQLLNYHDPSRQNLVEIFSGHGNSERWIDNQAYVEDMEGNRHCPKETASYLPGCQQAGRIIFERCRGEGLSQAICEGRAADARQNFVDAGMAGHNTVPGVDMWTEWADSAQCRDCFLPAFNYRRRGSAQYMLAMTDFSNPAQPQRLNFGFIAASDNHSARPGTGYKEFGLRTNTDARQLIRILAALGRPAVEPASESKSLRWEDVADAALKEPERFNSFWYTGGLVAVHAEARGREAIWDALQRKEVYGTSGPRILLWFDHLTDTESKAGLRQTAPMGSHLNSTTAPHFRIRAIGSLVQRPGCPDDANSGLGIERLQHLCQGECYNPSNTRRRIERLEVVRIRPQQYKDEPIDPLVEDPWLVHQCPEDEEGCELDFTDASFPQGSRDTIYYARAIEEASEAMNGANLGCIYDENGICIEMRDCGNNAGAGEDCLSPVQHRAWSSPIFINYGQAER